MLFVQSVSLKGIETGILINRKFIERTCLMSASCANISSNNLIFSGEVEQSYAYNYMSEQACFTVSIHPKQDNILLSLHSFIGHDILNKIVDHFIKIMNPEIDCCNFQEFTFN